MSMEDSMATGGRQRLTWKERKVNEILMRYKQEEVRHIINMTLNVSNLKFIFARILHRLPLA